MSFLRIERKYENDVDEMVKLIITLGQFLQPFAEIDHVFITREVVCRLYKGPEHQDSLTKVLSALRKARPSLEIMSHSLHEKLLELLKDMDGPEPYDNPVAPKTLETDPDSDSDSDKPTSDDEPDFGEWWIDPETPEMKAFKATKQKAEELASKLQLAVKQVKRAKKHLKKKDALK